MDHTEVIGHLNRAQKLLDNCAAAMKDAGYDASAKIGAVDAALAVAFTTELAAISAEAKALADAKAAAAAVAAEKAAAAAQAQADAAAAAAAADVAAAQSDSAQQDATDAALAISDSGNVTINVPAGNLSAAAQTPGA